MHRIVYPPRQRGEYCVVCFAQGCELVRFDVPQKTFDLHHALHSAVNQIGNIASLCRRCYGMLADGHLRELSSALAWELIAAGIEPTKIASAFLESEIALTVAAWCIVDWPLGSVTPGLSAPGALC